MRKRDRRFALFAAASLALLPHALYAQAAPARIVWLSTGSPSTGAAAFLRDVLHGAGLVEGKDYVLEPLWAEGHSERFPALAKEAVARKPALILVTTIASAKAVQAATSTIPIVMTGLTDPVGTGLIASIARPGGNTTGVATMSGNIGGKMIELVAEALPGARRVGVLINPHNASNRPVFEALQQQGRAAGIAVEAFEIGRPEDLDGVFAEIGRKRPDALLTGYDSVLNDQRRRVAALANAHRIPIVSTDGAYEYSGALVTYTAQRMLFKLVAVYVQKILAGAKPADLPVQQPTTFELVVNTRVAQGLKLKVPQSLVMRADRVIE